MEKKIRLTGFNPRLNVSSHLYLMRKIGFQPQKGNEPDEHELQDEDDDGIKLNDSVSEVMARKDRRKSGSVTSSSMAQSSTSSSARVKAEAKHAALLARASALRKRQELEAEKLRVKTKENSLN